MMAQQGIYANPGLTRNLCPRSKLLLRVRGLSAFSRGRPLILRRLTGNSDTRTLSWARMGPGIVRGEWAMQSHSKPRYGICPHCGCTHFHETQWKGFVERCVLYMWELRPYQCRECYKRFYLRPLENPETAVKLAKRV